MDFSLFVLLVIISLIVSLAAFVWGLFSGQFTHPERARYLPFAGEETAGLEPPGNNLKTPLEIYILAAIVLAGLLILAAPVLLTGYYMLME